MRVTRWQTTGKGGVSGWSDVARRMNTTTQAVRKRWKELSTSTEVASAERYSGSNGSVDPSCSDIPAVEAERAKDRRTDAQNPSVQQESVNQTAEIEIIDLTNMPEGPTETDLHSASLSDTPMVVNQMDLLVGYIIDCVHAQTWLLWQKDALRVLWRQLGVELGKQVVWFDHLWLQKLRYIYVQKYGYPRIGKIAY